MCEGTLPQGANAMTIMDGPRLTKMQAGLFPGNSRRVPATHAELDRHIPSLRCTCHRVHSTARWSAEQGPKVTITYQVCYVRDTPLHPLLEIRPRK
eukprot:9482542-Pyramimonas_sp.AAC.1